MRSSHAMPRVWPVRSPHRHHRSASRATPGAPACSRHHRPFPGPHRTSPRWKHRSDAPAQSRAGPSRPADRRYTSGTSRVAARPGRATSALRHGGRSEEHALPVDGHVGAGREPCRSRSARAETVVFPQLRRGRAPSPRRAQAPHAPRPQRLRVWQSTPRRAASSRPTMWMPGCRPTRPRPKRARNGPAPRPRRRPPRRARPWQPRHASARPRCCVRPVTGGVPVSPGWWTRRPARAEAARRRPCRADSVGDSSAEPDRQHRSAARGGTPTARPDRRDEASSRARRSIALWRHRNRPGSYQTVPAAGPDGLPGRRWMPVARASVPGREHPAAHPSTG